MRPKAQITLLIFALWFLVHRASDAYPVGAPLSLKELTDEADIVFKVVAVESNPVENSALKEISGFKTHLTQLRVVAIYQGKCDGDTASFQHYSVDPKGSVYIYMPQHYEFTKGRAYILFARRTPEKGVFQQLWKNHKSKEDQGLVLAADEQKHEGMSVKDVIWAELTTLLKSRDADDVKYAIEQLDWMTGGKYDKLQHYERRDALKELKPLITHSSEEIARSAIAALGSRNPYMDAGYAAGWLATVGKGHVPGYSKWDAPEKNLAASLYWEDLSAIVESDVSAELRALAIRALGRAQETRLAATAKKWLDDSEPLVRAAAIVLLADYPDQITDSTVKTLSKDDDPKVRIGLAQAIGFGQITNHVNALGVMINDSDPQVAAAAALSLVSFSLDVARMTLESNVDHPEFRSVFVNALASKNATHYVDQLADVIRHDLRPTHWWGGHIPWGVSWGTLFRHLQEQPAAELRSGKFDDALDALESPKYYSSSEPRDLYALYLQRDMKERAKKFRAVCKKRITYNIDYYFDMVDKSPNTYQRR